VQKIVFADGKEVDTTTPGDTVLEPDVAACEQNLLRNVVTESGATGTGAAVDGQEIFGKTGTTDNTTDAWFIGANTAGSGRQLATAVWFGNTANAPNAGFGGVSAAPVFKQFMTQALDGVPAAPLPDPGPVCNRPSQNVIDTGGRTANAPVVPFTPAPLPTVQQQPTPQTTPQTTPAATTPTTPAGGGPRQNGK
jgi:membrane peptidoglycan carboxypeptidase